MIPILNSTVDSFGWFYVCCVIRFSNDQQIFAIIVHDLYQRKMLLNTNISFLKTNVRNVIANTTNTLIRLTHVFLLRKYKKTDRVAIGILS